MKEGLGSGEGDWRGEEEKGRSREKGRKRESASFVIRSLNILYILTYHMLQNVRDQ